MNSFFERTWLRGSLHARPAGLLVRLVTTFDARVRILFQGREADTRSMLDVLALGADEGDRLVLCADGPHAAAAVVAVRELIERNFDQGLVPEWGRGVINGIAIGRAVLVASRAPRSAPARSAEHERRRAAAALARARTDLIELLRNLEPEERALFAPEVELLDAIEPRLFAAVVAGNAAEEAALMATTPVSHDLMLDARARFLDALDALEGEAPVDGCDEGDVEPRVLVVRALTPTLVARSSPQVVGIVVLAEDADAGGLAALTSHAVLLARGRGLPLAFVGLDVASAVEGGAWVIVDASGERARVWFGPDAARLDEARAQQTRDDEARVVRSSRASEPFRHFSFAVRANLSSLYELMPLGADGVGLLRTELIFAGRSRPPSLAEQVNAIARVVTSARGHHVVVRLFDGGGDKPLAWLPPPANEPGLRGIRLLFSHPDILETQLRAIATVASRADVRVLVPMTVSAEDVARVKEMAKSGTRVGAMIESRRAVDDAALIAAAADFVSIGTNDLSASLSLNPRESGIGAPLSHVYRAISVVVDAAQAENKSVTVCGELAADEGAALALVGLGVEAVSVAPSRFLDVKLALLGASREDCERLARAAVR